MKHIFLNRRGSTLIEVLVAIFIISVVFVSFQTTMNALLINRTIRNQDIALRAARTKIESLRATPFNALPSSGPFTDTALSVLSSPTAALTVTNVDSATKQIAVTITWQENIHSVTRQINLTTLISNGGI